MEITVPQNEKYIKLLRIFSHEFVGEVEDALPYKFSFYLCF